MEDWVSYKNGNYTVLLNLKNGTKIRKNDLDFFEADTIESMDIKITNRCNGTGCSFCFVPGTLVETDVGKVSIEDIKLNTVVKSYSTDNKCVELNRVVKTYKRPYIGELVCIELDSGEIIKCTPNHKILTERGYVEAGNMFDTDNIISI